MSIINNGLLLAAEAAAAPVTGISRSLRFNSADSAYLSRTPGSAGNRKTWTWAGWVKRSSLGANQALFSVPQGGGYPNTGIIFNSSDQLRFFAADASATIFAERITTAVYRDTSAWMHIVVAADYANTQLKIYVNGSEVTAFNTSTGPTNTDGAVNTSGVAHAIGQFSNTFYLNAYLADVYLVDGQALDPTSFGEFDTNGVWQPKAFSGGSYGTNGFRLTFSDNSGTSSTTLGKDAAGSNNWTPNNFSVAAGSGNDSLVDVPQNGDQVDTGIGGEVRGNYCTWNPLDNAGTLANGNLDFSNSASSNQAVRSTFALPESGKWYAEFTTGTLTSGSSGVAFGFANSSASLTAGPSAVNRWTIYADAVGYIFANNSTLTSSLGTFAAGTVLQIAYDAATGKAWVGKNNTWYNSSGGTTGDPAAGTNQTFTLSGTQFLYTLCFANSGVLNAGSRPFAYTAPSGFKALCTTNLPTPTIADGSTVMDVVTYTGNGSTQTISGLSFSPDLVWIKERNAAADHALYDSVRGVQQQLESNTTTDETTESTGLTAFNSDGFALSSLAQVNTNTDTYVAWCWDESATAGFDIVTYTGNGSARTISHGLGVAPNMIIVKARTTASTDQGWPVYHSANTAAPATDYLLLNSTAATADLDTVWNDTAPTSSVFSVGTNALVNTNNDTYVAYLFSAVVGYSSFGSYTGNGSADGPFVYTGFRSRWVMLKRTDTTGGWVLIDTARSTSNLVVTYLYADLSSAESTFDLLDITSNGFKLRNTFSYWNASGGTYVFASFAEHPFQTARAR